MNVDAIFGLAMCLAAALWIAAALARLARASAAERAAEMRRHERAKTDARLAWATDNQTAFDRMGVRR